MSAERKWRLQYNTSYILNRSILFEIPNCIQRKNQFLTKSWLKKPCFTRKTIVFQYCIILFRLGSVRFRNCFLNSFMNPSFSVVSEICGLTLSLTRYKLSYKACTVNTLVINKAAIINYIQGVKWLARGSVLRLVLVSERLCKIEDSTRKRKTRKFF